ncbi:MAG: hypothetical protein MUO82_11180 [Candidatus Thermoplasmatota archaeon]|nr:hypothetical protein [Candidatus Thermoplasmatota archaeon]
MREKLVIDEDLEEIFLHIQNLRREQNSLGDLKQDELEPLKIDKVSKDHIAEDLNIDDIASGDIFEIIGEVEETPTGNLIVIGNLSTTINEEPGSIGVCDICHKVMLFERNLAGLVIHSKFFACEKCCMDATKENLDIWAHSKNAKPEEVRPIAFWLREKENRTRLIE